MLTPVERVLVLKGADLLKDVGPRHLLGLANVAREIEIFEGERIYDEPDPADALYIVVEGKVELHTDGRKISEVGAIPAHQRVARIVARQDTADYQTGRQ